MNDGSRSRSSTAIGSLHADEPGDECLEPHEIELLRQGQLGDERIVHLESCPACREAARNAGCVVA